MGDTPKLLGSEGALLDSLYRISSVVSTTDDPHEALRLILDEVVRVLGASSASIALINPDTHALHIEVQVGLPPERADVELPLGVGVTGWVALHGKPLLVPDVQQEPRYVQVRAAVRSELAVPMEEQGEVIGVVNVDSERPDAFGEEALKILSLLTREAGRVTSRLWLIRQLKLKASQLQTLLSVAQSLVSKIDMAAVMGSVTREARQLVRGHLCGLFLRDETSGRLRLEALAGPHGAMRHDEELSPEDSAVGVALERRKVVEVFDLAKTEENHFVHLVQSEGLASMLSAPLVVGDRAIGVLNAYTQQPRRFNNDEKRAFTVLASLGAVAIQNARLYSRVFASEENLRKNERLTTLGLLAAEIAHEIRNPLTVIKLLFDSLDLDFPEGDARARDREVIGEKLNQLESIVGRVLDFGKTSRDMHARYAIAALIDDTATLVRLKLEQSHITLRTEAPSGLQVQVNKGQFQQVLLNLILNATEAIGTSGRIHIRAASEDREGTPVVRC
ncbi:MAG: GAF domain-containing protein [Verrucomicrobiota bacterium]